jgi:ATP-dependent Lhr-like helicase
MEYGSANKLNTFKMVKNAYPYRNLEYEDFEAVLKQLNAEHVVWLEDSDFGKTQKTRLYYYLGVSMIADEAKFFVKDITTNRNIGMFDESFVSADLLPGSLIISQGRPWNVVDIHEREVLVEPAYDISGAIPAWEGEEIPVPFKVAQDVGKMRREIAAGKFDFSPYHLDKNSIDELTKHIEKQKPFFMPDEKTLVLESYDDFLVMYSHFGSKINETLGKLLSILMSAMLGETVGVKASAYGIIFEFSDKTRPDLVKKFLMEMELEQVKDILTKSLMRTHLFKAKFTHVAKRFGLIEKDRDYQGISMSRVIEALLDSPIYAETLNEIFTEKLDVEGTKAAISGIQNGKYKIKEYKGESSPFTSYMLSKVMRLSELVLPQRPESEIIEMMMKQTNVKVAKLFCTYCKSIFYERVEDLPAKIHCPHCKSPMVAYVKGKEDVKKLFEKGKLSSEEKRQKAELDRISSLVSSYGKRAVIVLSGKGIGAETAVRVLGRMRKTEKEVFRDMLEAQKNFLKSKRYWN